MPSSSTARCRPAPAIPTGIASGMPTGSIATRIRRIQPPASTRPTRPSGPTPAPKSDGTARPGGPIAWNEAPPCWIPASRANNPVPTATTSPAIPMLHRFMHASPRRRPVKPDGRTECPDPRIGFPEGRIGASWLHRPSIRPPKSTPAETAGTTPDPPDHRMAGVFSSREGDRRFGRIHTAPASDACAGTSEAVPPPWRALQMEPENDSAWIADRGTPRARKWPIAARHRPAGPQT